MKFKISIYVLSLIILFFLNSCVTNNGNVDEQSRGSTGTFTPIIADWYRDQDGTFPSQRYITAIGTGETRTLAEQQALANLAQFFSVEVEADTQSMQRFRNLNSQSGLLSEAEIEISQSLTTRTAQNLIGVRTAPITLLSLNEFHILVYIDRNEAFQVYRSLLQRLWDTVDEFIFFAEATSNKLTRYGYLQSASLHMASADPLLAQLQLVNPQQARNLTPRFNRSGLDQQLQALQQQLIFDVTGLNDESIFILSHLRQGFSLRGFRTGEINPVLRFDISFEIQDIPLRSQLSSIHWELAITGKEEDGTQVMTFQRSGNMSGTSRENAILLAQRQIIGELPHFFSEFDSFIDRLSLP